MDTPTVSSKSETSLANSSPDSTLPIVGPIPQEHEYGSIETDKSIMTMNMPRYRRLNPFFLKIIKIFFPSLVFFKFFLSSVIPPIGNNIIPLFFTGNIPNESALALASQFMFIGIIIEVIQEGVVNSLFHFVGKNYEGNREKSLQALKLCLIILTALGSLLTICMLLLTPQFVNLIDTPESISLETRKFLYTSSFSFPMILLNAALTNFLLITTSSWLIVAQLVSVILSFLLNLFLFGQQDTSLHWGIESLGYYKVIQAAASLSVNFTIALVIEKISPFTFLFKVPLFKDLKNNFREFFNVSWGNFGDSGVRNFFYFAVTLRFINNLGEDEAGAWNLMNTIVWGLLFVPGDTVATYVKVKIGHDCSKQKIKRIAHEAAICLSAWILILSVLSGSLWPSLAEFFSKSNTNVQNISKTMFYNVGWIFIIFLFNNAMDSLFFGTGETKYVFYQSLITNLVVYFVPWVLYLLGMLTPTYWWVLGLFIAGMLVDFCLTSIFCIHLWRSLPEVESVTIIP